MMRRLKAGAISPSKLPTNSSEKRTSQERAFYGRVTARFLYTSGPKWIYELKLIAVGPPSAHFAPSRMVSVSTSVSDFTICCVRSLYFLKCGDCRCA